MLVQKQAPKRLKNILLVGGACIALLAGYVVYTNFFGKGTPITTVTTTTRKNVLKDFGQGLFRDPRFYGVIPRPGTDLITQSATVVPTSTLPAPSAMQAFDMQTGGAVLFTWKRPAGAAAATAIRITRVVNTFREYLATVDASQTSYVYRGATNGEKTKYEVYYTLLDVLKKVTDIPAVNGTVKEDVGITSVEGALQLQWNRLDDDTLTAIEVYRSDTVGQFGQRIARLEPTETSYRDAGAIQGASFYTIQWLSDVVPGETWSGEITATDATPPETPTGILATYVPEASLVRVTWSPSSSADVVSYDIFRSTSAMSLGSRIGNREVKDIASIEDVATGTGDAADCAKQYCLEDRSFGGEKSLPKGISYYYTAVAIDSAGNRSSTQDLGTTGRTNPFITL